MIIDSHTHTGKIAYSVGKNRVSNLPGEGLLAAMKKYSIDFALVSSIESAEFDSWGKLAPPGKQIPQLESFRRLVSFVRASTDLLNGSPFLKASLWVKPFTEKSSGELDEFIEENLDNIAGLKMHPSLSNMKFTDERFVPYLELAEKYNMPVQVHTENDGLADPAYLAEVARLFPSVRFIMVHMGLNTDNSEAMDIIRTNDNVYGDTCEVESGRVMEAIRECGSEKILFGTDAVVHGIDTYQRYMPLVDLIRKSCSVEDAENVLFKNCQRLYRL